MSGTKAARRVVCLRETRTSCTCGTERETKVAMTVMRASVARLSKGMKGREMKDMLGWQEEKTLNCSGDDKFVKVRKVAEKPW
jgi:hypothetical protein